jgi:nucleoside-diphosphate-sugar epimerase
MQRLIDAPRIETSVIHPAMVYEPRAGVFGSFADDALHGRAIRIIGAASVRWPLVHSHDLANLYALVLESSGAHESYIGSAIDGLAVGRIERAFARRYGGLERKPRIVSPQEIALEIGDWAARGYALDQQLSGAKARRNLGWQPQYLDPESEIAALV